MATSPLSMVIQHLLADFGPDGGGMTDAELLARFLSSRDGNALAALVRRHAPMVWGVCGRLLHNRHDAEDAFQATFLVLVRKAADVPRQAVANWLYGVARQTAVRLRVTSAKRGRRETQVMNMPESGVRDQGTGVRAEEISDLQAVLDEELSRLPDHYRGVIILCDLEGMTRKEAARHLAIPEGSVASRLARARVLLAKRLTQRGIVVSGGSIAAIMAAGSASGSPPALLASTVKAVTLVAAGQASATGVISAKVAALTEGVVKAMLVTKLKSALTVVLVFLGLSLATFGFGVLADGGRDGRVEKPKDAEQQPAPPKLQPAQTDQERIVGLWVIMNADSMRQGEVWNISKGRILKNPNPTHYYPPIFLNYHLDAGKDPKQIDIGAIKGIYVLDGDELRLCMGGMGKDRPAAFPKKPAPGEVLILQRQKAFGELPKAKVEPSAKTDKERMVGNWFITNEDSKRKGEMWVITETTILMHAKHLGANANRYLHSLDAGKDPKQIDITVTLVNGKTIGVIKGVYVLDGDELRLCLGAMDKDRPGKFADKPGPGEVLVLHRQNPGAEQPKAKGEAPAAKKVLTPEEAIKQMPKENVTVQFKVASVERTGWYTGYPATYYVHLKDGGKFTAWLNAHYPPSNNEDQILKLVKKLGIESVTDLSGKVVRVTGRVDESGLRMWVHDPANNVEVVKPKTDGKDKEQKPNDEKQPLTKEDKLRTLIDKVLAAHGGEDKLNKLQFTMTVKHSNNETQHYFVQQPKNFRWETTHPDRTGKRIVILFPDRGRRWWNKEPNEDAREFIPTGLEPRIEFWFDYVKFFGPRQVLRLKDADHKVTLLDEEAKIDGRAAVGVQVTGPQYKQTMYFDKETHLLLKGVASDINREVTFSDYKKFEGIPIAQKEHDGHFDPRITDFRVVDKFDAKLFEQP